MTTAYTLDANCAIPGANICETKIYYCLFGRENRWFQEATLVESHINAIAKEAAADHVATRPGYIGIPHFTALLKSAIVSSVSADHALILLKLEEDTDSQSGDIPCEATALIRQLSEIIRGSDMICRLEPGRYAILLHNHEMPQVSRKIAAIDFLRMQYHQARHDGEHGPTRIGTTFIRPNDAPDRALARAQAKLDRFNI